MLKNILKNKLLLIIFIIQLTCIILVFTNLHLQEQITQQNDINQAMTNGQLGVNYQSINEVLHKWRIVDNGRDYALRVINHPMKLGGNYGWSEQSGASVVEQVDFWEKEAAQYKDLILQQMKDEELIYRFKQSLNELEDIRLQNLEIQYEFINTKHEGGTIIHSLLGETQSASRSDFAIEMIELYSFIMNDEVWYYDYDWGIEGAFYENK